MSGSTFVCDAQGRPLMPTAAAYARTLMRDGKASLWAYPAFSVIQLSHTVAQPVLHPVLLGIRLHHSLITLLLFTAATQGKPLFGLTLACDRDLRSRVAALQATVATLQLLVPLSHIALYADAAASDQETRAVNQVMLALPATGCPAALLRPDAPLASAIPPALQTAFLLAAPDALLLARDAVATVGQPGHAATSPASPPLHLPKCWDAVRVPVPAGTTAVGIFRAAPIFGLVTASDAARLTLTAPVAFSEQGVTWTSAVLPVADVRAIWDPALVTILPILNARGTGRRDG
jgi:hypothetical protein